ncbi:pilus assembly protein TadG-related protein [Azospirillum soli]|uniref:pilus assembly protein TadG-related protein n=1 Tax=Azospirillum soli TaxID=1304799 RepID=UPI001AE19361|nr:pilus assembly protein TadG-related protein [Azospirillum soli]MBP2314988.1 Flp pilus assembly protein TadG [Azospirillum soli]
MTAHPVPTLPVSSGFLHRLKRDEGGAIAVMVALLMSVLLGMLSLGVEYGSWYAARRQLQTAADAAALAAALERARGSADSVLPVAQREALRNGLAEALDEGAVEINIPPTLGAMAGNANAVEAILHDRRELLFASLFLDHDPVISARAVVSIANGGQACVLALAPQAAGAIKGRGTADVEMKGCLLAANSVSSTAIDLSGNVSVNAKSLWTAGGMSQSGSVNVTLAEPPTTRGAVLADPYAGVQVGAVPACTFQNEVKVNKDKELEPGVYCGGLSISGKAEVTLKPGTYYIVDGDLTISGGTITGDYDKTTDGVTFVLTTRGTQGNNIGTVRINGNTSIDLRAPSDPGAPFRGLLFYQDRRAPVSGRNVFNGTAEMSLQGAMYFPVQDIDWAGNNASAAAGCIQVVARTVTFTGTAALGADHCGDRGERPIRMGMTRLSE